MKNSALSTSAAAAAKLEAGRGSMFSGFLVAVAGAVGGVLLAVVSRDVFYSIFVFVMGVILGFLGLLRVYVCILNVKDQTRFPGFRVYHVDGTVERGEGFTVFEHDNKLAASLAQEIPLMAAATCFLYFVLNATPILPLYTVYVAYRLYRHPLCRVHLGREPAVGDLARPFGATPLFDRNEARGPVRNVAGKAQFERALESARPDTLVVVDCGARWCPPCRKLAPKFVEIAEEHAREAVFLAVDIDESEDVASALGVTSIPAFFLYKDGKPLSSLLGPTAAALRASVEENL